MWLLSSDTGSINPKLYGTMFQRNEKPSTCPLVIHPRVALFVAINLSRLALDRIAVVLASGLGEWILGFGVDASVLRSSIDGVSAVLSLLLMRTSYTQFQYCATLEQI